ncbi:ABC transporter substrate-binding protein [Paenibacillus xylaniclasticus]|uniref:ABC transporter substrate-binding protein n=1 Tax=Paenibacillus xylaniclasticus TaxID=588083 RepID=UPI0013E0430C|nr:MULTISPECIES: extracellular solute-binding protein [Paenibacillus]GFN31522.1 hypothetical protein PCURB6_17820 [Paenibacillus curdlanolyticus]
MRTRWIAPALLSLFLLLQGCNTGEVLEDSQPIYDQEVSEGKEVIPTIRILTSYDHEDFIPDQFRREKNVNLEWQRMLNGSVDEILAALDSDNPPDLIEFDYNLIPDLMNYDTFEDLSLPPYNALRVAADYFPKLNMDRFRSLDGTKLVFMPHILQAAVTFYRADLMKQYGYPDDPKELGEYLESPERWMAMAKDLASQGKRIMQWSTDSLLPYSLTTGFFNPDGSYARNGDNFIKALDMVKEADALKLPLEGSIWDGFGKSALQNGELMLFINGEWADNQLRQWAPETADQWRKTRLPFNQYGIMNGYICAIPKQSKNKEAAWRYLEFQLSREAGYNQYLEMSKWYDKLPSIRLTPLDTAAKSIWEEEISWRYKTGESSESILSSSEAKLKGQLADRLELLSPFFQFTSEAGADTEVTSDS